MKKLHVAASPLTGIIYAGSILKDKITWGYNKEDVTIEALVAVSEHVIMSGKPVKITKKGVPEYLITVEKL